VLQRFIAKLNESMKLLESEQSGSSFGKNLLIIGSELWYMSDFSWDIDVIIVQSGLKLYDFTILAAGVETEQKQEGRLL